MRGVPGDFGGMMKEAQRQTEELRRKIQELQEDLKERVVEGTAGGGMVRALVNGRQEAVKIEIDPKVVDPDDVEFLCEIVLAAVRQGLKQAKEMADQEMEKVSAGIGLPGLAGLL